MKRKNKKGFTLIEMVLVIAIIVLLAAVIAFSTVGYLQKAKSAASSVSEHNEIISTVNAITDDTLN